MTQSTAASSGLRVPSVLTMAFVILKLTHVIAWSWWWVLSPLWISAGISLAVLVIGLVVTIIVAATRPRRRARERRKRIGALAARQARLAAWRNAK